MYDPSIGRWLEEDPLGFEAGDANLYRYVGNGPTNGVDPSGREGFFTRVANGIVGASLGPFIPAAFNHITGKPVGSAGISLGGQVGAIVDPFFGFQIGGGSIQAIYFPNSGDIAVFGAPTSPGPMVGTPGNQANVDFSGVVSSATKPADYAGGAAEVNGSAIAPIWENAGLGISGTYGYSPTSTTISAGSTFGLSGASIAGQSSYYFHLFSVNVDDIGFGAFTMPIIAVGQLQSVYSHLTNTISFRPPPILSYLSSAWHHLTDPIHIPRVANAVGLPRLWRR